MLRQEQRVIEASFRANQGMMLAENVTISLENSNQRADCRIRYCVPMDAITNSAAPL